MRAGKGSFPSPCGLTSFAGNFLTAYRLAAAVDPDRPEEKKPHQNTSIRFIVQETYRILEFIRKIDVHPASSIGVTTGAIGAILGTIFNIFLRSATNSFFFVFFFAAVVDEMMQNKTGEIKRQKFAH